MRFTETGTVPKAELAVISLGCDKNRVDTENALAYFADAGWGITADLAVADAILVNTCGFIDPAKRESIDAILEAAAYKKTGKCRALIVSGCLSQRYKEQLKEGIPEIDVIAGTDRYADLPAAAERALAGEGLQLLSNDINDRHFTSRRILTTPAHYAYLKIAEGCSNRCTYCAIPYIRGNYTSRGEEELIKEAEFLVEGGVKELILVAQDVTRYGADRGERRLIPLLEKLSALDLERIRLLYLYPEQVDDELIEYIAKNDKICKYVDIPLQHISDRILKRMGRRVNKESILALMKKLRKRDIFVRSTFIVGFPGESEEEFEELLTFLKEAHLYACGFFAYSKEEGTPAAKLDGQLSARVKEARRKRAYAVQNALSAADKKALAGKTFKVIYEDIDFDRQMFVGRTCFQTPEVDGVTYFTSALPVQAGESYDVLITGAEGEDLIGKVRE